MKFSKIVHELSPVNKKLVEKREVIQKKIDEWHKKGDEWNNKLIQGSKFHCKVCGSFTPNFNFIEFFRDFTNECHPLFLSLCHNILLTIIIA